MRLLSTITAALSLTGCAAPTTEAGADDAHLDTDASASDIGYTAVALDAENAAGVTASDVLAVVDGVTTFSASAADGEPDLGLLATGALTLTVDAADAAAFHVALYDKTWSEVSVPCSLASVDEAVTVTGTLSLAYTDLDDVAWVGATSVPSAGLTGTWPAGVMTGAEALWTRRDGCSDGRPFAPGEVWVGGELYGPLDAPTLSVMMLWSDCGTGDALGEVQLTR